MNPVWPLASIIENFDADDDDNFDRRTSQMTTEMC